MKRVGLSLGLMVVGAALPVLAIAFTTRQLIRLTTATRMLSAARVEKAKTRLTLPAIAAVQARAPAAAGTPPPVVSTSFVERLNELKKGADRHSPGAVPLIFPEDLFDYSPPLRQAYLEAKKGSLWVDYGPFFANARLTPAEIEQFCAIKMEREIAWLELKRTYPRHDTGPTDPQDTEASRQADLVQTAKLTELLGEERFKQFTQYNRELDARTMLLGLHNLVATTFYTDEPVTVAQMNQLAALAAEYGMFSMGKSNGIPDAFDQLAVKAAVILTPRQLEVFDLMLDEQQYSLAMWQLHFPDQAQRKK
jgi:hypothetical protein